VAEALVNKAHVVCPYSNTTRGNIAVRLVRVSSNISLRSCKENTTMGTSEATHVERRASDACATTTDLSREAVGAIVSELRHLLADVFTLYVKTKNFHWHMSGRHFRDDHLLLDEHAAQLFAMMDAIAERARKLGGATLRSMSDITRHQRLQDNNDACVPPQDMLGDLCADNQRLTRCLRATHAVCDAHRDVATASVIENWLDETERRTWFLSEIARGL
jgi:starvation-inducible DNA-binding protein